jgi:hypothetical protein
VVTAAALTVKDALVEGAGTVTEAGAVRFALSLARETVAPLEGVAALKLTVHVDAPGAATDAGVHARLLTEMGARTIRLAAFEPPLSAAATVTA